MLFFTPEFYDIFGIAVFGFLTVFSIWSLRTGNPPPRWMLWLILIVGILGLLVDGTIVFFTFL